MVGPHGQSGQSVLSPVVWEHSKGGALAMQQVTPALALQSRLASAAWSNAIAVVRFFFIIIFLCSSFHFILRGGSNHRAVTLSGARKASVSATQ